MTTHSTAVDHPSRRLVVALPQTYDEARERYESLVPEVDVARFSEMASWQATLELAEINAPHGFMRYYRSDILFANAGVGRSAPLGSITEEHFQLLFDINVKGVVFTVQALLPLIREHGSIILNSSVAADLGRPGSRGIRVNTVNPASTEPPGLMALNYADSSINDEEFKTQRSQGIPLDNSSPPMKSPMLCCSWRAVSAASPPAPPFPLTGATTRSKPPERHHDRN